MTVRWRIFVTVLVLVAALSSCKDDSTEMLPLDEFAEAQNEQFHVHTRSCNLDAKMESLMRDESYRKQHEEKFTKVNAALSDIKTRTSCSNPTIVPMAIHFQGISNPDAACLTALAQSQVDILNKDFTGTNTDILNWTSQAASFFPGASNGEACLQFCLADTNHPNGYGLSNGAPAVTVNKTNGDSDANWSGYINIFVRANTGVLGYSPLGGSGNGDGVVVDATAFGTGSGCGSVSPNAPFNLGRTLTHELGHYLLLDHIWGNGCNVDDLVADTPDQQQEYYGCPSQGASSCGSNDMHMSYMDYSNDACMYMFSAGQTARMEAYISSSLGNVTGNAANVCSTSGTTGGSTGGTTGGTGGGTTGGGTTVTCETPSAVSVANITSTSAELSWTAEPNASQYRIRYRESGTSTWSISNTTNTTEVLQNLMEATTYQYQVRTQCPAGWTAYTSMATFTTDTAVSTCAAPGSATVTNLSPNSVHVTWAAIPQAIRYRIRFRELGTSAFTVFSPTNPSRNLTNLKAGTTYQYQLRTRCPSGWTTWNSMSTFTTEGTTTAANVLTVKLTLDNYGSETTWELVNENGNVIEDDGPFQDGQAGTLKVKTFEAEEGCYTLYIDDSYGDGICCNYGEGSLELLLNGVVIGESDGQFGYYDYIDFCITANGFKMGDRKRDAKKAQAQEKHPPRVANH